MKILVVGSGGREHALVWKISKSPLVKSIYTAPGNGGTEFAEKNTNISIKPDNIDELLDFARDKKIDLTVVGPEDPLCLGIVDIFEKAGQKIFGPCKPAARLEASKGFAKEFMKKHGIPTPNFKQFDNYDDCLNEIERTNPPIVIKADGLALGKGVKICSTVENAKDELRSMMIDKNLGDAGSKIVLDKYIEGFEISYIALSDGERLIPLATSQDNKRLLDGDKGPNTGGMGAYSPIKRITTVMEDKITKDIMEPVIKGMQQNGSPFKGTLYAGLIYKKENPLVLEFNVRFGDPETQPLLFRMKSDIVPFLLASAEGNFKDLKMQWEDKFSTCVVIASGGYPGKYKKGLPITGPLNISDEDENAIVFHAGTKAEGDKVLTNGGRVLSVCVKDKDPSKARQKTIELCERIKFEGSQFRKDIGLKVI